MTDLYRCANPQVFGCGPRTLRVLWCRVCQRRVDRDLPVLPALDMEWRTDCGPSCCCFECMMRRRRAY